MGNIMKKPIYFGEGITEQLKHFAVPTDVPLTSNCLIMGSKQYEIYHLLIKKENKGINPDLADLKIRAILENAYMYPNWDYIKYPQADLSCGYKNAKTNKDFEILDTDIYEDPIYIYIGRHE